MKKPWYHGKVVKSVLPAEVRKPDRLIRFVGSLPDGLVAQFDPEKNLLLIVAEVYTRTSQKNKDLLWRTKTNIVVRNRHYVPVP